MAEDSVDTSPGAATTAGSTGTETGSNGSAATAADSQTSAASTGSDSSASSGAAATAQQSQAADGDRSLTDGAETIPPKDPPDDGYRARFIGQQKAWQQERAQREALAQRIQELEADRKKYEGVNLDQAVEHYQQVQGLKPWDEGHPDNRKFSDLFQRASWANDLARRQEDPAIRKAILDQHFDTLSDDDRRLLQEHQLFVRAEQQQQAMNPAAYYRKLVQQHAAPVVQQNFQNVAAQQQAVMRSVDAVQKWIADNPELATQENRVAVANLMQKGLPFEQAVVQFERDWWKGRVSGVDAKAKSVEEKERLLQGKAATTVARNPSTKKTVSFSAYLKEHGIPKHDGNQVANALFELQAKGIPLSD